MKKRRPPSLPTVIPIACLVLCVIMGLVGWGLSSLTPLPWWIALSLTPLILLLLPIEISHALRRRRICRHIREDFLDEEIGVTADYSALLNEIHAAPSPARLERARTLHTTGPSAWPTTAPTS